jgi:hypothetical protein
MGGILKKILLGLPLLIFSFFANTLHAYAMCPICTVAVAGGIGLTRWIGLDDTIAGVWIGALVISSATWTVNWLAKKKIVFPLSNLILSALYYVIIMGPLYWKDIVGHPLNVILGVDKLLFGSFIGVAIFALSVITHNYLKKRNGGKSYFDFQRVVIPVSSLIIASAVMYFVTK